MLEMSKILFYFLMSFNDIFFEACGVPRKNYKNLFKFFSSDTARVCFLATARGGIFNEYFFLGLQ